MLADAKLATLPRLRRLNPTYAVTGGPFSRFRLQLRAKTPAHTPTLALVFTITFALVFILTFDLVYTHSFGLVYNHAFKKFATIALTGH